MRSCPGHRGRGWGCETPELGGGIPALSLGGRWGEASNSPSGQAEGWTEQSGSHRGAGCPLQHGERARALAASGQDWEKHIPVPGKAGGSGESNLGLLALRAELFCSLSWSHSPSHLHCSFLSPCPPPQLGKLAFPRAFGMPHLSTLGLSGCSTYTCDPKEAPQHSEIPWAEIGIAAGIEATQQSNPNLLFSRTKEQVTVGWGSSSISATQMDFTAEHPPYGNRWDIRLSLPSLPRVLSKTGKSLKGVSKTLPA